GRVAADEDLADPDLSRDPARAQGLGRLLRTREAEIDGWHLTSLRRATWAQLSRNRAIRFVEADELRRAFEDWHPEKAGSAAVGERRFGRRDDLVPGDPRGELAEDEAVRRHVDDGEI